MVSGLSSRTKIAWNNMDARNSESKDNIEIEEMQSPI